MKIKELDKTQLTFAFRGTQYVPDYVHDRYYRCECCRIKYLLNELKQTKIGYYLCKFCSKKLGVSNA